MIANPGNHPVTLVGADYSVYTRAVRLVLELKCVAHDFEELDVFAEGGREKARRAGHPFGKIPVLRHGDLTLYETLAITRYIDERFDGAPLQPDVPATRARMNQIISLVDTQVYPVLIWGLYVPKSEGRDPQPGLLETGHAALDALETLAGDAWLCGDGPTLADAYLAACMDYVMQSAAAPHLSAHAPRLKIWWQRARELPHLS